MTKLFLHTILIEHCAPKDRKKAIVQYILTDSEDKIYHFIDKELLSGIWNDHHNDSLKSPLRYSDEDGNFIKMETFKEKMMRLRGPYFDPFADYSDLYYGVTHYGWTPPQEISLEQQQALLELKIAIVL